MATNHFLLAVRFVEDSMRQSHAFQITEILNDRMLAGSTECLKVIYFKCSDQ